MDRGRVAHYKLTSTVILHLDAAGDALGALHLGGNLTRQVEQDLPVESDGSHIVNIGRMVEDMEIKIRNLTRAWTPGRRGFAVRSADRLQRRSTLERPRT